MIEIKKEVVNHIVTQGREQIPLEACGYLAGEGHTVIAAYSMVNVDQSPDHFRFDPHEQFVVLQKAREQRLTLIAVYHTHPTSPAWPSPEDCALAYDPEMVYVIVSLMHNEPTIKAFRIIRGTVLEEEMMRRE